MPQKQRYPTIIYKTDPNAHSIPHRPFHICLLLIKKLLSLKRNSRLPTD